METLRSPHLSVALQPDGERLLLLTESGLAVVGNTERDMADSTFARLSSGLVHFSSAGEMLISPETDSEGRELVYLVRNRSGGHDLLSRAEFERRIQALRIMK